MKWNKYKNLSSLIYVDILFFILFYLNFFSQFYDFFFFFYCAKIILLHPLFIVPPIFCVLYKCSIKIQNINSNENKEYVLRVQRGTNKINTWRVLRRYNDFAALNKCLQISGVPLQLPGKKIIGKQITTVCGVWVKIYKFNF